MRLQTILDQTLDLLEHPEFKCFGDLQKHRYQMEMTEEEKFLRSDMYKGQVVPKEALENQRKAKKKWLENPESKEVLDAAKKKRLDWYKNPENKKKFMEKIKKRNLPKKKKDQIC